MDTNGQQPRTRVRLVATNSLRVAGFQGLFGDPCGIEVFPVSVTQALALDASEVVLIDSGSFRAAGSLRQVLERFRRSSPKIRLIVVGSDASEEDAGQHDADNLYIQRLIQAGAKGFIRPSARPEEFSAALQWVRGGSIWAPRQVLSRLVQRSQSIRNPVEALSDRNGLGRAAADRAKSTLTPRENQVLRFLLAGRCNREIGESLGIGPDTVKAHLGRIMRKAGVANRIELMMYALADRGTAVPLH